jgi:LmbE family N-acetylglucosaminyl deacetylase
MIDLSRYKNVLVFFAHPDDETLAAGGVMNRLHSAGAVLHVAIPATGIHSRRNLETDEAQRDRELADLRIDCEKALSVLGVSPENIHLGQFPDNEMDSHSLLETIHWLEALIDRIRPDLILTHHRYCTNIDHQYCHNAAVVATRPWLDRHITVLAGEVPSSTGYLRPTQWEPNCYIEISAADLETKIRAMQTYKSEARPDPHPRSPEVLRALAKVRGSESGFYFAEAFMIQKIFG